MGSKVTPISCLVIDGCCLLSVAVINAMTNVEGGRVY